MFVAIDENNNKVFIDDAIKGGTYFCPACNGKLFVKDGLLNAKHFAHKSCQCTDLWHYDMSDWHRGMQKLFPPEYREVVVKKGNVSHRADILIDKTVIEFQHSTISADEFLERTNFFLNNGYRLAWVFDLSLQFEDNKISYSETNDTTLEWKNPMRIFADLPKLSDYNKDFSLWFSWTDYYEPTESLKKAIWTPTNEYGQRDFSKFIVSPYTIDVDTLEIDKLFLSMEDHYYERVRQLREQIDFSTKYIGVRGYSRSHYVCPRRNEFGLRMSSEKGCQYCRYCAMVAMKKRGASQSFIISCSYPNQAREEMETHPGYECPSAPMYRI